MLSREEVRRMTFHGLFPPTALRAAMILLVTTAAVYEVVAADTKRPNIVLIVADDLGAHDLGCYGADLIETPNLDRLAADGVRFAQAYAPAPVCTPTRAALMTGQHPARLRMTIWSEGALKPQTNKPLIPGEAKAELPLEETTLAELLHEAGYATAVVGKWHLGGAEHAPEQQGFDVAVGGTHWGAPQTFFWPYRGRGLFNEEFRYVPGLPLGRAGNYLTDALTDAAIRFIDDAGDRPFFLYWTHYAPHTPIEAPDDDVAYFASRVKPELRHQNVTYAAMIRRLDADVGRLLAHLKRRGLTDRTLVVFTSDNGGYIGKDRSHSPPQPVTSNAPLRSGKGSLYEGGIRVPLIVSRPDAVKPGLCNAPVVLTDLFFTLSAHAGVQPTVEVPRDGIDRSSLLVDATAAQSDAESAKFWHYPHYYETTTPVSAVRAGRWKLLHYYEDNRRELYDLKADPGEEHDLAAAEPERVATLGEQLDRWLKEVNAALPTANAEAAMRKPKK
jgi:arylsulfatase A-like enzyme